MMYSLDDGNIQMLCFNNATVAFCSFTQEPEVIKL